jgi:hypothetical protein
MTLTLDLPEELETRLTTEAARLGLPVSEYALRLLSTCPPAEAETILVQYDSAESVHGGNASVRKALTARELLAMASEDRQRLLAAQAEDAEALYETDLERGVEERELTALTALDAEPFDDAH